MPSASMSTTVETGTRRLRMQGTPPIWSERTVMRVNVIACEATRYRGTCAVDGLPELAEDCGVASWIGRDALPLGGAMSETLILLDAAGRRRSPATTPGFLAGRAPRNKGMEYPPDPPHVEEILVVMRQAGRDRHGLRARALIAVVWRA